MHLRHARLRSAVAEREHLLLVYGDRDELICWCGPYTAPEAYRHALQWGGAGWAWPSGRMPAVLCPPKPKLGRPRTRESIRAEVEPREARSATMGRTFAPKRSTTRAGLRAEVDAERVAIGNAA